MIAETGYHPAVLRLPARATAFTLLCPTNPEISMSIVDNCITWRAISDLSAHMSASDGPLSQTDASKKDKPKVVVSGTVRRTVSCVQDHS
jgi:hypothetical protein